MSERYVNIEDETFPSFLAESMSSNLGETLDNCTLTSNLGLPVAASTVAKARTAIERLPDVQASYLESEKLPVTTDHISKLCHSSGNQNGKFALSFKDDLEDLDAFIGAVKVKNQVQNAGGDESSKESSGPALDFLPTELNGFSSGLCSDTNFNKFTSAPSSLKYAQEEMCDSPGQEMSSSVASFLENEKLISIASLDGSSSDEELNDEEFYDDELEEYFKQLRPPGIQRGVIEGQEIEEPKRASDMFTSAPSSLKYAQEEMCDSPGQEMSSSVASFLENEKLISIASLDGSSSDEELNDEEFYDDELEEYFKQLRPPGIQRGVIEGQEIEEPKRASDMAINNFSSGAANQDHDALQYDEDFEEDFQMLQVRLAATGMDSAPASDDDDLELELERGAQQPLQREHFLENTERHLIGEQHRPSFRPGLEGGSSEEESSNEILNVPKHGAALSCRQSAEGHGQGLGLGDGSNGSKDGLKAFEALSTHTSGSRKKDIRSRNVAGEESLGFSRRCSENRIAPVGNGETRKELSRQTLEQDQSKTFKDDLKHSSSNLEFSEANVAQKLDSIYFQESRTPNQQSVMEGSTHLSHMFSSSVSGGLDLERPPESGDVQMTGSSTAVVSGLADEYLSPTYLQNKKASSDAWQSFQAQAFQWSFDQGGSEKGDSSPPSVVYQNEEGKWVTDLAYYKPFDSEHTADFPGKVDDQFNEGNFIVGSDVIAKLDEDQEEFEKEHRFIQEEKMDLENLSFNLGDTSWKMSVNTHGLLKSQMASDLCQEDASYLRLSLGEFFGQRSEALGCLGGGNDVKRPSFGYHIMSPEKQEPFALLRKSEISENLEHDDTITFCDDTLTPEDLGCLPDDQKLASATFDVRTPANKSNSDRQAEQHKQSLPSKVCALMKVIINVRVSSDLKLNQTTDVTLLNISTIASAIANASCSADPSELAAMILALSNKSKGHLPLDASASTDSFSRLLQTSLKNCNPESIFDVEKYLKATVHFQDTQSESFDHSVKDFPWDMSQEHKKSLAVSPGNLANITDVQKQDLRRPENSKALQVGCVKPLPVGTTSDAAPVKHSVPSSSQKNYAITQWKARKVQRKIVLSKFVVLTEIKTVAGYVAHTVDEEQYSFRPSTSPLIHSSPSQDSLKIPENGSGDSPPQGQASVQRFSHAPSSPESSCLSPSFSRLTYISATENTGFAGLQDLSIQSPEKKKSNNTIELSTTIVRASPTPSEMQLARNDNLSWEDNKSQITNNHTKQLSRSPSAFRTVSASDIGCKSGDPKQLELDPTSLGGKDHNPFSWQEHATKSSQILPSANMPQSALLEKYAVMQTITGNQCACVPGFKPVVSESDVQKLPSSVSSLFSGQSLSNTPFTQQYLGNVNPLLAFPGGNPGFYGVSTGYPSCNLPTQNIQNAMNGVPLNANIGPGLLATWPMSSHTTTNQNIDRHIHLLESQAGTTGLSQWTSSRMSSGFGQVLVPEEVTFPSACCVGIASQTSLNIFNPNERWMQVNIGVLCIAINGEKIDIGAHQCLVFKNKTIIGPRASEDIKILLLPHRPGLFQCVLSVSSWPVSADTESIVRADTMASKVLLAAVSEYPLLEVDPGKSEGLDFGDLSSGGWKALPLKIMNRTRATVPIRLIISANATAWRCFTFSKDPINLVKGFGVHTDPISKMSSPSVISHVMQASHDGQEPECFAVWVVFHAPQTYNSAGSLGPPEEFTARVDIEIDSPGPACMLKCIQLRARVGCARIHAPKDLQIIRLTCIVGSSAKQLLPLKNAGNISAHLKVMVSCPNEDGFSVDPEDLFLAPGEEQIVAIKFSPRHSKTKQSTLKIMVQPSGPQYEVMLVGDMESSGNTNSTAISYSDVPSILSNKQFIAWGGVGVGRAVQQKLILRNMSATASQQLRLIIRGQDQDCFQLQSTFGSEQRLTNNLELTIRPKEDSSVHLMFSPTHIGCMLAKLEIKQSGIKSSQPGIKFTIPLSGYGGTSNVILEDVKKLSDSCMVTLNGVLPGRISKASFSIRNTGSRAAYVKAVCFLNVEKNIVVDSNVLFVTPDKFILKEGSQEIVTISYKAVNQETCHQLNKLCTVCFFCGDEVSRQQFRRAVLYKPEVAQKVIAEFSKLRNTRFDEEFPGEQLVCEVYDLPQRPNDIQLFYGNMRKIMLSVVEGTDVNMAGTSIQPFLGTGLGRTTENTQSTRNTSLDVLPVKGPQGPHLSNADVSLRSGNKSENTFIVQPGCLQLTTDGFAGTGQVQIHNKSSKLLEFDLSWPPHWLTVTPQHGSIDPQSHTLILVNPNPSLSKKQIVLPWNGHIYVHCDNGQKMVKVQIIDGTAMDGPRDGGRKSLPMLAPRLETPVHVAKPLPKTHSAVLELKNRTLVFPKTAAGESSETFLEMENPGDEDVKWHLSSFAAPYVKGVDRSDDIYRATYTVFRCARVSGALAAHDRLKVAVTFFPKEQGDYTQFWDLECHPISEPHLKHKVRFQLCGEGMMDESASVRVSNESLVRSEAPVHPRRRSGSEASSLRAVQDATARGVFASEQLYTFPPTPVGESSTLKVNLKNNSFTTYMLKFDSPKEPFHMKHSKYSLRAHHYINLPVKFKPSSKGRFEGCLVVQTDAGDICIQLVGEALAKR
ncbi:PREDICTED: centrosomal protein of 192 kDa [Nanorana parkeri]|uniref:centrosomal protein of 192 kDa n=1 Tax=Nanorana parkeri TaxID=125878 RepID=UPI0008540822|nr:PREDICTED: centrosomal protein of 192 kDa [Nanorana parkeri]